MTESSLLGRRALGLLRSALAPSLVLVPLGEPALGLAALALFAETGALLSAVTLLAERALLGPALGGLLTLLARWARRRTTLSLLFEARVAGLLLHVLPAECLWLGRPRLAVSPAGLLLAACLLATVCALLFVSTGLTLLAELLRSLFPSVLTLVVCHSQEILGCLTRVHLPAGRQK